jgi:cobalamin synthase
MIKSYINTLVISLLCIWVPLIAAIVAAYQYHLPISQSKLYTLITWCSIWSIVFIIRIIYRIKRHSKGHNGDE